MTNLDIRQHAARFAAEHAAARKYFEPTEAWQMWSTAHAVDGPGARLLFELEYARRCRESRWWRLLSALAGPERCELIGRYLRTSNDDAAAWQR